MWLLSVPQNRHLTVWLSGLSASTGVPTCRGLVCRFVLLLTCSIVRVAFGLTGSRHWSSACSVAVRLSISVSPGYLLLSGCRHCHGSTAWRTALFDRVAVESLGVTRAGYLGVALGSRYSAGLIVNMARRSNTDSRSTLLRSVRDGTGNMVSEDGRWLAEPSFRLAYRGPNEQVRDGWTLVDTLTGARHWFEVGSDMDLHVTGTRLHETEIGGLADRVFAVNWKTTHRSAPVEVSLVLSRTDGYRCVYSFDGHPACLLGVFSNDDGIEDRVAALLATVGLPSQPKYGSEGR